MKSVEQLLLEHSKTYPLMQPCDAVKLLYQRVFGGGHLISSENDAVEYIRREYDSVPHGGQWKTEILGETARVYLDSTYTELEIELLARVFCASSQYFCSGWDSADDAVQQEWENMLVSLYRAAEQNLLPFDSLSMREYLRFYREKGYPAVRHSKMYRDTYRPAYRVIDSRYIRLWEILKEIAEKMNEQKRIVLVIDGRCASGKTTAARLIAQIFPSEIIHMDDFFLPGDMRIPERMAETGGNLHRERFMEEVIPFLRDGAFSYRVFQCSTFSYAASPRRISDVPLLICEGSYALHPSFGAYYDIAVFSDVDPQEQLRRIRKRDGEEMLRRFRNEWIPMEERYFENMKIRERCNFIV